MGFEDLAMVDIIITQFITAIRTCENDGLTSDKEFRGECVILITQPSYALSVLLC